MCIILPIPMLSENILITKILQFTVVLLTFATSFTDVTTHTLSLHVAVGSVSSVFYLCLCVCLGYLEV